MTTYKTGCSILKNRNALLSFVYALCIQNKNNKSSSIARQLGFTKKIFGN